MYLLPLLSSCYVFFIHSSSLHKHIQGVNKVIKVIRPCGSSGSSVGASIFRFDGVMQGRLQFMGQVGHQSP
jgi:hypothetical protein